MFCTCTQVLLESAAAQPSDQPGVGGGGGGGGDRSNAESNLQGLARAAVDRALEDVRGEGVGCVSEEHLREEVEDAVQKLVTDGTGLRDYANVAIGGQVVSERSIAWVLFCMSVFFVFGECGGRGYLLCWLP